MKNLCLFFLFLSLPLVTALTIQNVVVNPSSPIKGLFIVSFSTDVTANATLIFNPNTLSSQTQSDLTSFTFSYSTPPLDGNYTLQITANSTIEGVQQAISLIIDNTAPTLAYALSTLTPQSTQFFEINATATDPNGVSQVNLTGTRTQALTLTNGRWTAQLLPSEVGCPSSGSCSLTLHAKDLAGNDQSQSITLTLNTTSMPPQINLQFPLPNAIQNNSYFLLQYTVNESIPPTPTQSFCTLNLYRDNTILRQIDHYLTNFTNQAVLHLFSQRVSGLKDGLYTMNLSCINLNSAISSLSRLITIIDRTNPSLVSYTVDPFEQRALLSGETDEETTVQLQYASDLSMLSKAEYQSVTVTGKMFYYTFRNLNPKTNYYYQITLQDYSNNRLAFGPYNFTTYSLENTSANQNVTLVPTSYPGYLDEPGVVHATKELSKILANTLQKIFLDELNQSLTQIEFLSREDQTPLEIDLYQLSKLPVSLTPLTQDTAAVFYIHHPSLDDKKLQDIRLQFKVLKNWLAQKEYTKESIQLERYENDLWIELPTQVIHEDTYTITYQANSPGLSLFAITANPNQKFTLPAPKLVVVSNSTNSAPTPLPSQEQSYLWLWIVLLFVILFALGTYLYLFTDFKNVLVRTKKQPHYATLDLETQAPPQEKVNTKEFPPNFDSLCSFVQRCVNQGLHEEKIKIGLAKKGWKLEYIEEAIRCCTKSK
ncbi:MAG: PGF-pre-PGF domain-containing protein [Nanoarchaeota archaeon]|mgnify:CR=1 FL=1